METEERHWNRHWWSFWKQRQFQNCLLLQNVDGFSKRDFAEYNLPEQFRDENLIN